MNIKTANRLCELRKKHGLSQEDLADKLGVSRQAISKWERSESSPDTDNLIELAKLYGISLDELINDDKDVEDIIKENKEADRESKEKFSADEIYDSYEDAKNNQDKIYVDVKGEDGDKVVIGNEGIFVESEDGDKVHISTKGIKINNKSIGELIKEKGNISVDVQRKKDAERVSGIITGLTALLVTIAYLLLGFFHPAGYGFAHYWFLFICIPVPGSLVEAIMRRKAKIFCYPLVATATFCALGMFMNIWHPLWVIFITIPVYYMICNIFKKDQEVTIKTNRDDD